MYDKRVSVIWVKFSVRKWGEVFLVDRTEGKKPTREGRVNGVDPSKRVPTYHSGESSSLVTV